MARLAAATILSAVCALGVASSLAHAAETLWTRSKLLAISDAELTRLGYDRERMGVSFDLFNSSWREYLARFRANGGLPKIEGQLKDKNYWAVCYAPLYPDEAGDLWVFVDKESGDILETLHTK